MALFLLLFRCLLCLGHLRGHHAGQHLSGDNHIGSQRINHHSQGRADIALGIPAQDHGGIIFDLQRKKGQLLITFDKELLEGKGYCLETPVLITNSDDYLEVLETASGSIRPGEELLKALR